MGRLKARGASKSEERAFTERAEKISREPDLLVPACAADKKCSSCPFDKIREQLIAVSKLRNDPDALRRKSGGFFVSPIIRAYAGFLTLLHTDKNVFFLVANYPAGKASYVNNSKSPKEIMIGVQNYDNPKWRLLGYLDYAKRGYHLYATRDKIYCSGHDPRPPEEYVTSVIGRTKYSMRQCEDGHKCQHISEDCEVSYLTLKWRSVGLAFSICEKCASAEDNLYCRITETMLSKDAKRDFDIAATFGLKCIGKCSECALEDIALDPVLADRYFSGEMSDEKFLHEFISDVQKTLTSRGKRLYASGNTCYGADYDAFVSSLQPNDAEKRLLTVALETYKRPLLLDSPTPGKVLSACWSECGVDVIEMITGDRDKAEKLFHERRNDPPLQIVKDAAEDRKKDKITSELPIYSSLPPIAMFADRIARAYRFSDVKECIQIIDKVEKKDMKMKSVAYAFLMCFDAHTGRAWQYTKDERDYAEFLKNYVTDLLAAEPGAYDEALRALLAASGSGGEIKRTR